VGVSSHFGQIRSLANIEAILRERTAAGVRSLNDQGFQVLQKNVARYQNLFAALRSQDVLNPSLIQAIGGNEADARRLLTQLNAVPNVSERIDRMEQYFAQRCANSLVLAMLVTHRADGRHTLDRQPEQRFITPKEEANLSTEFDQLFREIVGTVEPSHTAGGPARHGTEGMWEAIDINYEMEMTNLIDTADAQMPTFQEIIDKASKESLNDSTALARVEEEARRTSAFLSRIARAWVTLKFDERRSGAPRPERARVEEKLRNLLDRIHAHLTTYPPAEGRVEMALGNLCKDVSKMIFGPEHATTKKMNEIVPLDSSRTADARGIFGRRS
jgi:hypothetical protein